MELPLAVRSHSLLPYLRRCTLSTVTMHEFIWTQDRIDHIARHRVRPEEVEEVCFGQSWVRRAKATGRNPVYYILGKPDLGDTFLCCHPVSEWKRVTSDSSSHDGKRNDDSTDGKNNERSEDSQD